VPDYFDLQSRAAIQMEGCDDESIGQRNLLLLLKVYGAMILLGPVLLRAQFRFKAKLNPQLVPSSRCPPMSGSSWRFGVKSIADLGFEPSAM